MGGKAIRTAGLSLPQRVEIQGCGVAGENSKETAKLWGAADRGLRLVGAAGTW